MAAGITIGPGATLTMAGSPTITTDGDWDNNGTFVAGSGTVIFNGTTSTFLEAGISMFNNLTVNKTDAADANDNVTVQTDALDVTGMLEIQNGELIQGTTALTLATLTVDAAGKYTNSSTGDLQLSGTVANAGSIIFNSSDDAGDGITITSSASPAQRNWQGAGVFSMTDVTPTDQTCIGGTPPAITVFSGTNGGNNINWLFGGGVLAAVSVTPADLVAGHTSNNTVVFTTTSAIASDGKIRVTFPAGFDLTGVTTATSAADLDGTLTVGVAGQVVTITRSGGTNFAAGGTVNDLVIEDVVNPAAAGLTGVFTVETLDNADNVIDTGTGAGVVITPVVATASTTTLTDSTGASTGTYTVGSSTTGRIYISVDDSDENTNALAVETVSATLTSASTGDSETVTLTETGVNTGIFNDLSTGLAYDADDAPSAANGTFETRNGDTVTASYTDNDDGADVSSDTATVRASDNLILATLKASPTQVKIGEPVTFTATIQNLTAESLSDFKLVFSLPPGLVYAPDSGAVSSGGFAGVSQQGNVAFEGISALAGGTSRSLSFRAVAGSHVSPGNYPASYYAQFNPIISNTALVTIRVNPDPVFNMGTLIGKVFQDFNGNGVQDQDEPGVPNAVVATEQGTVITADGEGRYHVPDLLSGRHMIKIDRASLPGGSELTTPESILVNQTDAMLTKVNFGVRVPEDAAASLAAAKNQDLQVMLRTDTALPVKRAALQFHEITYDKDRDDLVETASDEYKTDARREMPVLPFRIDLNYGQYVKNWSVELNRYEPKKSLWAYASGPDAGREIVANLTKHYGNGDLWLFRHRWELPFKDGDKVLFYELRLTLEDEKGNRDVAIYDLHAETNGDHVRWKLELAEKKEMIPVTGTKVTVEGRTHAKKIVSVAGREMLSGNDGTFGSELILPSGSYDLPVDVFLDPARQPERVVRHLDLRDTVIFWVGFGEVEWGTLDIKGNIQSATPEDKARFQDSWYDETRVAYYLKGKIKGKYLITASIDTDREKRELFRNLNPDDFYAVYGDGSKVVADANDTQDKYYLLLEVDKSYFKYGNFNTGFTGTEFADFNRTLHGGKAHYETLSLGPDGKPVTFATAFAATARQMAARNEFTATGGSLYYLKHRPVVMGSEKVKAVVRDKLTGVPLKEIPLVVGQDYEIDYDESRIRLFRPVSLFSTGAETVLSTEPLAGNPQFLVVDYEYTSQDFTKDPTSGARASHSLFGNMLRIGGTWASEEKQLARYELYGVDSSLYLPANTAVTAEYAKSSLQGTGEFISTDGGLTFTEIRQAEGPAATGGTGEAYKIDLKSRPWEGGEFSSYYRTAGPNFSSNGSISETGTEKYGFAALQDLGAYGKWLFKHEAEKILEGGNPASLLNTTSDQVIDLLQYTFTRDRWNVIMEYRGADQTDKDEQILGAEANYWMDTRTKLTLSAGKSLSGSQNDLVRGGVEREITKDLSVHLIQSAGTRGFGTLFGLDTGYAGMPYSFYKGIGSLKDQPLTPATSTDVGFSKKFGKDSHLSVNQGVGSDKRDLRFSRSTPDGRTVDLTRSSGAGVETTGYSETQNVSDRLTKYSQSSVTEDTRTGQKGAVTTQGYKAKIWGDRASLYQEQSSAQYGDSLRSVEKSGFGLKVGDKGRMDLSYEQNENRTAPNDTHYQVGRINYDYFDFGKLHVANAWEARLDEKAQNTLQLNSIGKAEIQLDPDWTALGRYEWSGSRNRTTRDNLAKFSEIQVGLAYRPVNYDRFNGLAEYKYFADTSPTDQQDLDARLTGGRHIGRMELAWDLNPYVTFVEKLALRSTTLQSLAGGKGASTTFLAAQRVNWHVTRWLDLSGEYRFLSQSAANDATEGILAETSIRLSDALRLAVGYSWTRFEAELAQDLNVEISGFYFRVVLDGIESLRGSLRNLAPTGVEPVSLP